VAVDFDEHARWLVLTRGPLTVAANVGDRPATVPVGAGDVILASADGDLPRSGGAELAPESVIVLKGP
jgi:maltooligosyltrehalose trehalohydrolase